MNVLYIDIGSVLSHRPFVHFGSQICATNNWDMHMKSIKHQFCQICPYNIAMIITYILGKSYILDCFQNSYTIKLRFGSCTILK